MLPCINILFD
jgi:hypothetical protein